MLFSWRRSIFGKDPTKLIDLPLISRDTFQNVVASGIADKCTLQLAYAIGVSDPLSIYIDTHDTSKMSDDELIKKITPNIDLSPRGIRDHLIYTSQFIKKVQHTDILEEKPK